MVFEEQKFNSVSAVGDIRTVSTKFVMESMLHWVLAVTTLAETELV